VIAVLLACVRGGRLSITSLGRSLSTSTSHKHAIKRVDRLVGSPRFWAERLAWYRELARRAVGNAQRIVVLLDWTEVNGRFWTLTATLAGPGRGIPIYQEVHRSKRGKREIHRQFLVRLSQVLPRVPRVVLVADAEYRTPFFRACRAYGFDFVIRLRRPCSVMFGFDFASFQELMRSAGRHARCLGLGQPYNRARRGADPVRVVLGSRPTRRRTRDSDGFYRRRALEPWLLATTLENEPATDIVNIYAKRMQIEETFRDTKNVRFGWGLELSGTQQPERMDALFLLAALAAFVVIIAGLTAENHGHGRRYQANTTRARRVLSAFTLGTLILREEIARATLQLCALQRAISVVPSYRRKRRRDESRAFGDRTPHDLYCADCGDHFAEFGWPD